MQEADAETEAVDTSVSLTYRYHCQTYGWQSWVSDGATAGTTGQSKRIEAVRIKLTGELAECYDVYYRAHCQTYGWLDWTCNGEVAGTTGLSKRLEAIQIVFVSKGAGAPGSTGTSYVKAASLTTVAHSQTYGWLAGVSSGEVAGSTSASKRLEALRISLSSPVDGGIAYRVSVKGSGWTSWASDGATAGTTGQSKALEAVEIELTGDATDYYNVWYRVYVDTLGWLGWASNGQTAGTGLGLQIEAIQVKVAMTSSAAPGSTSQYYVDSISGDATLDSYLTKIYAAKGKSLKTLFNYVSSYKYIRTYDTPSGSWSSWSITYAKEMYEDQGGNCYRYAALFCWLARGLGYNAKTVTGYVSSYSSGWAPHGWVEIVINGTTYVYDPDLAKDYPSYNWYKITYATAPITYKKSS